MLCIVPNSYFYKKYWQLKEHYRITVIGRVQGVWFRKYTKDQADLLKIMGFVQNKQDGCVYIEAEGDKQNLEEFIDWLYQGSPMSKVKEVIWERGESKSFNKFEIIR